MVYSQMMQMLLGKPADHASPLWHGQTCRELSAEIRLVQQDGGKDLPLSPFCL